MTSTCSANATGLPDRRHFLSTIAGAGALSLPVLPAMAWTPGPIETMWPEHLRLEAEYDAACERTWDAEERYEEPERPRWHPFSEEGGYVTVATRPGHGVAVLDNSAHNLAYLKETIAREHEPDDPDVGYSNAPRAERARKTLAKIEAWTAEVERRKDAAGLTTAEGKEEVARSAAHARRAAIFAIEATTFRELAFQAELASTAWREEHVNAVLERLVALAGIEPHHLG